MTHTGTAFLILGDFSPWPPVEQGLMGEFPVEGGNFGLYVMPNARIKIILTFDSGESIQVETCPIENSPVLPKFILTLSWNAAHLAVDINHTHVASTDKTKNIESRITLPLASTKTPGFFKDISAQNEDWRLKRISQEGGVSDLIVVARVFEQLSDELLQLKDLLAAIRSGKMHHIAGLVRQIRALICTGKNMNPLMQRAGGILGLPLLLYDIPPSVEDFPQIEGLTFSSSHSFSADKNHSTQVPMDLDVWLEQDDSFLGMDNTDKELLKKYTNNKVIRAFADKEAAHYDRELDPLITYFKQIQTPNGSWLHTYFVSVGECVLKIGEDVVLKSRVYFGTGICYPKQQKI